MWPSTLDPKTYTFNPWGLQADMRWVLQLEEGLPKPAAGNRLLHSPWLGIKLPTRPTPAE